MYWWVRHQKHNWRVQLEKKLVGVQGTPLQLHGTAQVCLKLGNEVFPARVMVADSLTIDVILGRDFLKSHQCTIEMCKTQNVLRFRKHGLTIPLGGRDVLQYGDFSCQCCSGCCTAGTPCSEMEVMGKVLQASAHNTWILEGNTQGRSAVMITRAVVKPAGAEIPIRVLNLRDNPVTIPKGTAIAEMELLPECSTMTIASTRERTSDVTEEQRCVLWEMATQAGDRLSQPEKEQLYTLLLEYEDLFAKGPDDFGRTGSLKHKISTGDAQPIRQQVRRIPPVQREEARKLLREMLDKDVIQPSSSPWASPVVLVRKKDGSTRFCVDYRKVNAVTRKDAYPLPRVDDTLDMLVGAKWFSTLDLISGYWQVEMSPDDQEKTAFCTTHGLFEFKVMPFGLCNAPATFQRLMDMVLAGLLWTSCLVYLDDAVIIGKTFTEHLQHLRAV